MDNLYIITGAAGHLGNVLSEELIARGESVRAFILSGEDTRCHGFERIVYGDILKRETLIPLFKDMDGRKVTLIHCAGIVYIKSKYSKIVHDVNVYGTKNVLDLCKEFGVNKFIYISSVHALPEVRAGEVISENKNFDPEKVVGYYAKTKAEASRLALDAADENLEVCIIHPSGIIGPYDYGQGHMTGMVEEFCNNRLLAGMTGGYDFVDVRDVVNGIISCAERGRSGESYILSNRYYTIKELLNTLSDVTNKRRIKIFLPKWLASTTAPFAEIYYKMFNKSPLFTKYSIYTLTYKQVFSHEKADRELGYSTRDIFITLKDTYDWLVNKGRVKNK